MSKSGKSSKSKEALKKHSPREQFPNSLFDPRYPHEHFASKFSMGIPQKYPL
jgi:hypothetical protein